jgi:hypothetical protein
LPWAIEELYNELVEAFREGDPERIVRQTAYLTNFAAKAAFPFNASANYDGKLTGNLDLGRVPMGHPHYAHRDVAVRFGDELVRRNRGRYADRVHPSPGDYDPVFDPLRRARAVLLASLTVLDEVAEADAEILELMEVAEGKELRHRADEYYPLLDRRCGDICVERLRHGAVFAANLVGGAWETAGKPPLGVSLRSDVSVRPTSEPDRVSPRETETGTADGPSVERPAKKLNLKPDTIVGSVHSTVYHFWRCRFAKQISPENLVTFESVAEAKADGRRPCRGCRPPE